MNPETRELYQQVILDHNKTPRNFRKIENATRILEGYNPLCGDRMTLFLMLENDRITDAAFTGSGCAISKASASLMTTQVKGKTTAEATQLFDLFHALLTTKPGEKRETEGLGKLAVFSGVCEFPARIKCAILAWHTLEAALKNKSEPVSTE